MDESVFEEKQSMYEIELQAAEQRRKDFKERVIAERNNSESRRRESQKIERAKSDQFDMDRVRLFIEEAQKEDCAREVLLKREVRTSCSFLPGSK